MSGFCLVDLEVEGRLYRNLHLSVLPELCADLTLGLDFQSQHKSVIFEHAGSKPSVSVCGLNSLNMDPPNYLLICLMIVALSPLSHANIVATTLLQK